MMSLSASLLLLLALQDAGVGVPVVQEVRCPRYDVTIHGELEDAGGHWFIGDPAHLLLTLSNHGDVAVRIGLANHDCSCGGPVLLHRHRLPPGESLLFASTALVVAASTS